MLSNLVVVENRVAWIASSAAQTTYFKVRLGKALVDVLLHALLANSADALASIRHLFERDLGFGAIACTDGALHVSSCKFCLLNDRSFECRWTILARTFFEESR